MRPNSNQITESFSPSPAERLPNDPLFQQNLLMSLGTQPSETTALSTSAAGAGTKRLFAEGESALSKTTTTSGKKKDKWTRPSTSFAIYLASGSIAHVVPSVKYRCQSLSRYTNRDACGTPARSFVGLASKQRLERYDVAEEG